MPDDILTRYGRKLHDMDVAIPGTRAFREAQTFYPRYPDFNDAAWAAALESWPASTNIEDQRNMPMPAPPQGRSADLAAAAGKQYSQPTLRDLGRNNGVPLANIGMAPNARVQQAFEALGQLAPGNIPLAGRPRVPVDGGYGTIRSMSFGEDGRETLIPTIQEGRVMSPQEAIEYYRRSGQHLGQYSSPETATAWGELLSQGQGVDYGLSSASDPYALLAQEMLRRR